MPPRRIEKIDPSRIPVSRGFSIAPTGLSYAEDQNDSFLYQNAFRGEWTPVLSATGGGLSIGSTGTAVGEFLYFAGRCWFDFTIVFGGSGISAGSGTYELTVPLEPRVQVAGGTPVGQVHLRNSGVASKWWTVDLESSISRLRFADPDGANVTDAVPWVWGSGDSLRATNCMMKVADV